MNKLAELPDTHDLTHLSVALEYVKHFRNAVDVGAHQGIWTRRMAARFGWVYAFEPVPDNAYKIPEIHNVTTRCVAVGDKVSRIAMAAGPENTGQWHRVPMRKPGENEVLARMVTLDMYYMVFIDFLKIDVEGMEALVLRGGAQTIVRNQPVVMIEENGLCVNQNIKPGAAGRLLHRWGYRLARRVNKDEIWVPPR